jgi:hypothetical protein
MPTAESVNGTQCALKRNQRIWKFKRRKTKAVKLIGDLAGSNKRFSFEYSLLVKNNSFQ